MFITWNVHDITCAKYDVDMRSLPQVPSYKPYYITNKFNKNISKLKRALVKI